MPVSAHQGVNSKIKPRGKCVKDGLQCDGDQVALHGRMLACLQQSSGQ